MGKAHVGVKFSPLKQIEKNHFFPTKNYHNRRGLMPRFLFFDDSIHG